MSAFVGFSFGQGKTASAAPTPEITEFDVNGLKVIFKRRTSSPTLSAGLFVRGGVKAAPADKPGIENLTLVSSVEGSRKYPNDRVRSEMAETGSAVAAQAGTDLSVISMITTRANLERTWALFTDLAIDPTFAKADIDRVRDAMTAGLRNANSSPDSALGNLEEKIVYAGHPYANQPEGTIEGLAKLTSADLAAYHKTLLQTSRLLLVVVGDSTVDQIKKLATESFGKLPKGNYVDKPLPKLVFNKPTVDIVERQLPTNYVKGVFYAPSLTDPDYYAMRVAMVILQSRVYNEVRIKRNLSYAPNAEMDNDAANTANIYVTSVDPNTSVKVMLACIEDMKTTPIDQDEFEGVPGYFLTTHYLEQETDNAQVGELARYELIGGGWKHSLEFTDGIKNVTLDDVRRVSEKYMKDLRFVVVGDAKAIDKDIFVQK